MINISRSLSRILVGIAITAAMAAMANEATGASEATGVSDDRLVLNQEQIQVYNVRKIYDLLNRIPGLKASSTSLIIRGSSKVKVFLDGRSINDPTSSHGGIKWDAVDLQYVEKIIILKGKGGVEYGDDASGGVVVITLKPIDRYQSNIEIYGGNHSTFSLTGSSHGQIGRLGGGVTAGYFKTQGFRSNGDKRKRRIENRTAYTFTPETSLDTTLSYFDEKKGNSGLPGYKTPYSRSFNDMVSGIVSFEHKDLTSKTYANRAVKKTTDPSRNLDSSLDVFKAGQELTLPLTSKWTGQLKTGLGYEFAKGKSSQFSAQTEEKAYVYAAKTTTLANFSLDMGIRGIYYSVYENILNPEIGMGYTRDPFSFKFTVSYTNNVPSFKKKYMETSTTIPNPELTLEKAQNLGLSFSYTPTDWLALSAAPFYNLITDRISYVRGDNGIGQYENFGRVTYAGADISLTLNPLELLNFQSSYTYLKTKNSKTGLWLSGKPRHRWISTLTCNPMPDLSLGLTLTTASSAFTNSKNTKKVPGYGAIDFRAEYNLDPWRFFLELDNLLDKEYHLGDGYEAAPFTWTLGLSCNF